MQKMKNHMHFKCIKRSNIFMKFIQQCKNEHFWKLFKFLKRRPNRVLSSGKYSYWVFEPNSKKWWKFIKPIFDIVNIAVKVHFLHDFEKVKKWIFADIFWRRGPMTLLMCGKKTYDPSGSSPEIFFNLSKNWQKYRHFESCHFFRPHSRK